MIGAGVLDNLKIALRRERRLITIFVLTILVPSVALGVFGIRAIKTERFRLAKQLDDEHRKAAESIKQCVSANVSELETILQALAGASSFKNGNYGGISKLTREKLGSDQLVESSFVAYGTGEPFFPLFQPAARRTDEAVPSVPSTLFRQKLQDAEQNEFVSKNLNRAAVLYAQLAGQAKDKDLQALMISNEARCLMKLRRYEQAARNYERIERDYPEAIGMSGAPLALLARLQTVSCYRELDDPAKSGDAALGVLEDILGMRWDLSEGQFRAYVSLASGAAEEILNAGANLESGILADYRARYDGLKRLLREKVEQWNVVQAVREDIVPDLRRRQSSPSGFGSPLRFAKTIGDKTFLILAESVPNPEKPGEFGFAGISIKADSLLDEIRASVEPEVGSNGGPHVVISDLEGKILLGEKSAETSPQAVTEFFDDNFPPWKIELSRGPAEGLGIPGLEKSFYFWTIITLVVILTFGAVLIVRTIGHEMDVLRLKSDFVASVSHEFKTPLTSMRALLERLQGGKVTDPRRMNEYFSLISRNTDQLNRLVKNLLDFSKIEEGKREYRFAPTDIVELVSGQVAEFKRNELGPGIELRLRTDPDAPRVSIDREAVSQAVANLLDNAVKFSPGNEAIDVHVGRSAAHVFIEVADKGIGIPQDELERVFEKFYQGRNAAKQSARGTGLGLTLVKHMVEAHGGEVSVVSRVGEGSTFRLAFPITGK
jgi:signal transduction histidine kinase/tetratricopeptide (TPR) repeat protein